MIGKKITIFCILTISHSLFLTLLLTASQGPFVLVVPGLNGDIGYSTKSLIKEIQPVAQNSPCIATPRYPYIDLGQKQCKHYVNGFEKSPQIGPDKTNILFGTSQGTATSINCIASLDQQPFKALLLHSVMLSGNSAMYHTVTKIARVPLDYLPFGYYLLPYIAKPVFPLYAPAGEQPVFNVNKIPKDLPILIFHCTNDRQLSCKDAQGLYAALVNDGNKQVYFFEMPDSDGYVNHFVNFDRQTRTAIKTILYKHGVIQDIQSDLEKMLNMSDDSSQETVVPVDLQKYQPVVKKEWTDHFNTVLRKETRLRDYFDKALKTTLLGLIAYFILIKTSAGEKILNKVSFSK